MDNLDIKNIQLSYQAIYNETLCESMYDLGIIGEERAPGVKPYKSGPTQAEVRADAKIAAKKKADRDKDKEGYGPEEKFKDWKLTSTPSTVTKTGETISQRMDKEAPYKTRPFSPLFTKQGSRTASAVTRATEGPGEPQSVTLPRERKKPKMVKKDGKWVKEAYDIVLEHLLDEGYAETIENAEAIMVNMSEEWVGDIVEGYKKLPVGRMIKQAAHKAYYDKTKDVDKVDKQVSKMARVANRHSLVNGKGKVRGEGQAKLNRLRGED